MGIAGDRQKQILKLFLTLSYLPVPRKANDNIDCENENNLTRHKRCQIYK